MTSRRPMIRSFSANGRSSSLNEEDAPPSNGRTEGRNYLSNVRPENRSTFCSVMAQLTEETQPFFETTVKSKAVSETCNVKFTCVVSGYPVPELTWYKDDMEMDRYCGLPKYEIGRNGKMHTLHIYNCTVDDAAIYQASARNSKGIVSCSGVLEVGTMSEFKIHQRFFARLKQKAENKRRELEESLRRGRESVQNEQPGSERSQRKRKAPEPPRAGREEGEENPDDRREAAAAQGPRENGCQDHDYVCDSVNAAGTELPRKDTPVKKKIQLSNGVEGLGGDNSYDGGLGLAQYLAISLQSQAPEDKPSPLPSPEAMETDSVTADVKREREQVARVREAKEREEKEREARRLEEKERERMRERLREEEREREKREQANEREKERSRWAEEQQRFSEGKKEAKSHARKEAEPHQSALTSVLYSLKDIFFGKSKKAIEPVDVPKGICDPAVKNAERDRPATPSQPRASTAQSGSPKPNGRTEASKLHAEVPVEDVPVTVREPRLSADFTQVIPVPQEPLKEAPRALGRLNSDEYPAVDTGGFPSPPKGAPERQGGDREAVALRRSSQETSAPPGLREVIDGQARIDQNGVPKAKAPHQPGTEEVTRGTDRHQTFPNLVPPYSDDLTQSPERSSTHPHQFKSESDEKDYPLKLEKTKEVSVGENTAVTDAATQAVPTLASDQSREISCPKSEEYVLPSEKGAPILNFQSTEVTATAVVPREDTLDLKMQEQALAFGNITDKCELNTSKEESVFVIEDRHFNTQESNSMLPALDETVDRSGPILHEKPLTKRKGLVGSEICTKPEIFPALEEKGPIIRREEVINAFERKEIETQMGMIELDEAQRLSENKSEKDFVSLPVDSSSAAGSSHLDGLTKNVADRQLTEVKLIVSKEQQVQIAEPGIIVTEAKEYGKKKQNSVPTVVITEPDTKVSPQENLNPSESIDEPNIEVIEPGITEILLEKENGNEAIHFPEREIFEPDLKAAVCHSASFPYSKTKSEQISFQMPDKINMSDIILTDNSEATIPVALDMTPTQENIKSLTISSPDEKMQEVTQLDQQTRIGRGDQLTEISGDWVSGNHATSIPTSLVSHNDDIECLEHENAHVTVPVLIIPPKAALSVVPPVASTSEESPDKMSRSQRNDFKEIESLAAMLRGVQIDLEAVRVFSATTEQDAAHRTPPTKVLTVTHLSSAEPDSNTEGRLKDIGLVDRDVEKSDNVPKVGPDSIAPQRDQDAVEKLGPVSPVMSPTSLRRFATKGIAGQEAPALMGIPAITVDDSTQSERRGGDQSGQNTPTLSLSRESSPKLKRRDSLTLIPSATPAELASGARRKIFIPKSKGEEAEAVMALEAIGKKEDPLKKGRLSQDQEVPCISPSQSRKAAFLQAPTGQLTPPVEIRSPLLSQEQDVPYLSPGQSRRATYLQASTGQQTPPGEKTSPLLSRRKATLEVPKLQEEITEPESPKTELGPVEAEKKEKLNPFKAPQVIRKIRGEPFPDTSGHLKLWCQFFNVLSDSTIKWYRDEVEIAEMKRSAGDESQVALAIVHTSSRDCGVYGCSIKNEFGSDMTDFLLSADILSDFFLREDLKVGEEIEMTPMLFTKGLADSGYWGDKFFGRIMTEVVNIGEGCTRKACRVKVIYGLDPVFESGSMCITKVRNPIAYGTKEEGSLTERNLEITKQECKIQNTVREYSKIFAAEGRVVENFGTVLEVIPLYQMYRPANSIPYSTVETDLEGDFLKYCFMDASGRPIMRTTSEVEQKCCTFQHWIYQWTNGNLLVTQLEGVGVKITNVLVATKSKGYQGLTDDGSPKVFEHFLAQHHCNYYCGLLGLRPLKSMDTLQQPPKMKSSRSPLLNRKTGSSSPQMQKKGVNSPQSSRKGASSPKVAKKTGDSGENSSSGKNKTVEIPTVVNLR